MRLKCNAQTNKSISRLSFVLIFALAGCAAPQAIKQPTEIFRTPPITVLMPGPMPSPSSSQPPMSYPPSRDEPQPPQTIVERAIRHLAGWIHTPVEEIRVVSVEAIDQMPPISNSACSSKWEILDDGTTPEPKHRKLVTLQVRGKNYRYYAAGEALLLCPF